MKERENKTPSFEKYKKEISQNKKIKKNAIIRGLFFLFLCVIITYIGKIRPKTVKTVSHHGLLIWVFQKNNHLSSLIIYPNDGDYSNKSKTGERIFIHPLVSPEELEHNHIRYNKKDLFLLGNVDDHHVKNYCSYVDDESFLYYQGNPHWQKLCPRAQLITAFRSRLTSDWSVQSELSIDSISGFLSFVVKTNGQGLIFTTGSIACKSETPNFLCINHDEFEKAAFLKNGIHMAPGITTHSGKVDSSLVLINELQAVGIRLKKTGELELKKIWLDENPD